MTQPELSAKVQRIDDRLTALEGLVADVLKGLIADGAAGETAPTEKSAAPQLNAPPTEVAPEPAIPTVPAPAPPTVQVIEPTPVAKPEELKPGRSLEIAVGGRLAAWGGAAGVVLAVAFFLKHAIAEGWISETARCLAGAGCGLVMVVLGEIARRSMGKAASLGFTGAGLVILYLVSWAAFGYYQPPLISESLSFVFLGIVAALGFGITLHTRYLAIGVMSIVGGYFAPLVVGAGGPGLVELGYLTALLAVSLGLSAFAPEFFRPLRPVAMGAHMLVMLILMFQFDPARWPSLLVFASAWWLMVVAECTVAALRRQSGIGNVVASFIATGAFVTFGAWILRDLLPPSDFNWIGPFSAFVGILSIVIATLFGPGLDTLRGTLRCAMDKLALALWLQGGVLFAVAIAVHFEDYGDSIGWLALALACVESARRLPSRGVGIFGLIVGGLAVGRILLVDMLFSPALQTSQNFSLGELGQLVIDGWSLLAILALVAMHTAAWRLGTRSIASSFVPWKTAPVVLATASIAGLLLLLAYAINGAGTTVAWLIVTIVLLQLRHIGRPLHLFTIGLVALAVTAGRWLAVEGALTRFDPEWTAEANMSALHVHVAIAMGIAAATAWAARLVSRWNDERLAGSRRSLVESIVVGAALLIMVGLSYELDAIVSSSKVIADSAWPLMQHRALWLIALWTAGGFGLVTLGRARAWPIVMSSAALMILLASVAWLTLGTVLVRLQGTIADVPFIVNLQAATGCIAGFGLLGTARAFAREPLVATAADSAICRTILLSVLGLVGLCLGSMEIDRFFAPDDVAVQTGLSIYWCVFALGTIVLGFARRHNAARIVGLSLMSLTILKVLVVDLANVGTIWRVASFGATGLLLIATSMIYARLAPRLLGSDPAA